MNGLSTSGNADYVKFRGGRDALGPVFPLFAPCDCRGHLQPGYARAERHLRLPDVGPVQGRNPLALRFLRRFRLAKTVEGDRLANERLEGGLVNFFSFVDVDRAARVSVETRVEETGRILQRRALGEGKLHDILVGFASADDAVVRPNRSAHPLPLLDDVRVCFLDELAHSAEGFPAPVPEFGDSFRDELRCRLALTRARLFHVRLLEVAVRRSPAWPARQLFLWSGACSGPWARGPTGGLNAELLCILGVQSLPAAELHRLGADDASDRLTREEPLKDVETNVPPGSTH